MVVRKEMPERPLSERLLKGGGSLSEKDELIAYWAKHIQNSGPTQILHYQYIAEASVLFNEADTNRLKSKGFERSVCKTAALEHRRQLHSSEPRKREYCRDF